MIVKYLQYFIVHTSGVEQNNQTHSVWVYYWLPTFYYNRSSPLEERNEQFRITGVGF